MSENLLPQAKGADSPIPAGVARVPLTHAAVRWSELRLGRAGATRIPPPGCTLLIGSSSLKL